MLSPNSTDCRKIGNFLSLHYLYKGQPLRDFDLHRTLSSTRVLNGLQYFRQIIIISKTHFLSQSIAIHVHTLWRYIHYGGDLF